jgi:hypothetical protein
MDVIAGAVPESRIPLKDARTVAGGICVEPFMSLPTRDVCAIRVFPRTAWLTSDWRWASGSAYSEPKATPDRCPGLGVLFSDQGHGEQKG